MEKIKKNILHALNKAINIEYATYFKYRQAGHWFSDKNYPGTASYFFVILWCYLIREGVMKN